MFFSLTGIITFLKSAIFIVGYIQSGKLFPEPLNTEEEKIILERMKNGDEEARNILIERNLRLVAHISKKYLSTNIDQDDLISIGTIGLIKGINSFDTSKNIKLATYAARCIENAHLTLWNYMTYSKQHLKHYKVDRTTVRRWENYVNILSVNNYLKFKKIRDSHDYV